MLCCGGIERVTDKIRALYDGNIQERGVGFTQIIEAIVAGSQNQAARTVFERSLMNFQLHRIDDCLLTHRFHNAAGAEHRKAANDADVWIERLFRGLFPTLDGDKHGKAAFILKCFGFF